MRRLAITIICLINLVFAQGLNELKLSLVSLGEPVQFATVSFSKSNMACISDKDGIAKLSFNSNVLPDSLIIRHLNFERYVLYVEAIEEFAQITMVPKNHILPETIVTAYSAELILRKCIESLALNFGSTTDTTVGFYRQYHMEDGKYVRLIEAVAAVEGTRFSGGHSRLEKVSTLALRRSFNYEKNGEEHGDHLIDLLNQNPVYNGNNSILNEKNIDLFHLEQIISRNDLDYTITFSNKPWNLRQNIKGFIEIDKINFAVKLMVIETFPNPGFKEDRVQEWQFQNGIYQVEFEMQDDYYQVVQSISSYNHLIFNKEISRYTHSIQETFEWTALDSLELEKDINFSYFSNLYRGSTNAKAPAWHILSFPELPVFLQEDLEQKWSLEHQFTH